jgi:hypothetical protein
MRVKTIAVATLAGLAVAFLAACGPTKKPNAGSQTPVATPASSAAAAPAVKDLPIGNCTVYSKSEAVKLLGAVNMNNKNLEIGTDGGTKIDNCSYMNFKGGQDLEGTSYAVVRYDSATTAFAEAKKLQTEMLGSAADNGFPVQSMTLPSYAGPVLTGYGSKNDNGLTYSFAVVGTNVGPYLVVALGASTESVDNAKKIAATVFQALATAVA